MSMANKKRKETEELSLSISKDEKILELEAAVMELETRIKELEIENKELKSKMVRQE